MIWMKLTFLLASLNGWVYFIKQHHLITPLDMPMNSFTTCAFWQTHTHTNTSHSWFLFHTISPLSLHFECQSIQGADADTCGICVKRYVEQWICFASVMFGLLFSSVTSDVYKKGRFSAKKGSRQSPTLDATFFLDWFEVCGLLVPSSKCFLACYACSESTPLSTIYIRSATGNA